MRNPRQWVLVALMSGGIVSSPAGEAYPRTASGVVELKNIPAQKVMEAEAGGSYFDGRNSFMTLFRYIRRNNVAMTTPVETDVAENRMRFFVGQGDRDKPLPSRDGVRIADRPSLTVVSAGLRGSYTREHYEEGLALVRAWLKQHPEWVADGAPWAVYWNSPFMPGFLKKSEVHQPVRRAKESAPEAAPPLPARARRAEDRQPGARSLFS